METHHLQLSTSNTITATTIRNGLKLQQRRRLQAPQAALTGHPIVLPNAHQGFPIQGAFRGIQQRLGFAQFPLGCLE